MKRLLNNIIHAGVDANILPEIEDEVRTLNVLSALMAVIVLIIGGISLFIIPQHGFFIGLLIVIQLLYFFVVLSLNAVQRFFESKLFFSINISTITILLLAYYGTVSNFQFIIPLSFLSFIFMFRNGSRKDYLSVLANAVVSSLAALWVFLEDFQVVHLHGEELIRIRIIAYVSLLIFALVIGTHLFVTSTSRFRKNQLSLDKLSREARMLSTISANVDEAFFKSNPLTGFEFMNESFPKIFGYRNVKEMMNIHPDQVYFNREDRVVLLQKLKKERSANNMLMRYRKKDGSMFYGRLSCNVISEGGSDRIVGVITDVTLQQQQEELVRMNELRLREAQRIAKLGNWQIKERNFDMIWSEEAFRVHGYTTRDTPPRIDELVEHFDELDLDDFQRNMELAQRSMHYKEFGDWYVDPLGIRKFLQYRVRYVRLEKEKSYWVGTVQDVTELKMMEKEVAGNTSFFETILNNAPLEVAILDADLKYVFVSEQSIKNPDIRKWIIGKTDFDYCEYKKQPTTLAEERKVHFLQALNSDEVVRWEEENVDIYGRRNFIFRNAIKVIDPVDEASYIVGFAFNISRLRESQISLENKNEELQKLNQELDRFVYSVSHDLRAPIASVIGLISLAEESDSLNEAKQILAMQREALDRLDVYIRDVIDYSRNKRIDARVECLEIDELVATSLSNQAYIPSKDLIEFFFEYDEGKHVWSDQMRVQIVINNLLSNAIKYYDRSKEHPYIKVGTKRLKDGLEVVVADNGIGISKNYQERIWEMFYRGTSESSGSGLGLYILKESLHTIGGTVTLLSEEGKGTTFTVFIPDMSA